MCPRKVMNIFKGKFANIKSISTTKAALQKPNRKSPIVKDIAEFRHNDYGSEVRMQNYPEDRLVSQLKPTKHLELEEVSGLAYGKSLRPKNVNLDIEANVEPLEIELSDDEIVHHRKF